MSAKLEPRYIVIKRDDAKKYLTKSARKALMRMVGTVREGRELEGRAPFGALVIEDDWPEYLPTAGALLARINRELAEICPNCDCELPEGCRGTFKQEQACALHVEPSLIGDDPYQAQAFALYGPQED